MCGINGFNFKDEGLIRSMNEVTRHRGPDGSGFFVDDSVSLGHNLLAIIETPANSQGPYETHDKHYVLTYNGEIYNYKVLRTELEQIGERFTTNSDTEVLLKGLARHGIDFAKKLDGMFAFAWYDKREQQLYLVRDSAGMKPLYFYTSNGRLIFSSEIRAILTQAPARLNRAMAQIYFVLGYVPGPDTLFADIHRVVPGQYVCFNLSSKTLTKHWFGFERRFDKDVQYDAGNLREMIGRSVRAHTMGLRPFGLYLSGGLDSTVILHELAKDRKDLIKTYTTRFDVNDPHINQDADYAKRLCGDYNIEHHELLVTERDFIDAHDATIETLEEPRYHISMPAYWLLAKHASRDIVVTLSGNGGDELFMGYDRYVESARIAQMYQKSPAFLVNAKNTLGALYRHKLRLGSWLDLSKSINKWARLNGISDMLDTSAINLTGFDSMDVARYLESIQAPPLINPLSDSENTIAELDRMFWLADEEFMRADKIAMHFGLEGRFPFLAKDIVRYANSIPAKDKLRGGSTKALIREAYRGHLPDYIIEKPKTGWYAPTVKWLRSDFGKHVRETLSADYYPPTAELFNFDFIRENYFDNVSEFTRPNIKRFMPIFAFQVWAKMFNVTL